VADILCFFRNRCTTVEQMDDQTLKASCRLQDPLLEAWVEILVKLPDLEIARAWGAIIRSPGKTELEADEALKNVVGIRVGPGLRKILKGVMGSSALQEQLTFMVEECCGSVILSFTKDVLAQAPKDSLKEKEHFWHVVRSNPRLYNSCAAFAPGSPLVEGIEPPR
jgi:hypothetical protein